MAIQTRKVKNKRDARGCLTGRDGSVYDVNIKYKTPEGKKATYEKRGFLTKKEAMLHEAAMKSRLQAPSYAASLRAQRKQSVREYLEEWLEHYVKCNLRPSTYDDYRRTIGNYIVPYIGHVPLNQLSPAMVDRMFQEILAKGLKPSTAAGAKRVLSVALGHARKYGYVEINAARDTLTKFGKPEKTPDPYTPEQMRLLLERIAGTDWELPVVLGGLYGLRRSEILGLRWKNVYLEEGYFDVVEQLPFNLPPRTVVITEFAPPKSEGRRLPLTEITLPFFIRQQRMQEEKKAQTLSRGKPYYDNGLVVTRQNGAPRAGSWISTYFHQLLENLQMPRIRFHDLRHSAATNMHQLTGDFYTAGEVLGHTLGGIGASLGLPLSADTVTARYVDVRLERKKQVLEAYHRAVLGPAENEAAPQKST